MNELDSRRLELKEHLLTHAVRTGDFVLKSGRRSSWFIDGKQTACDPLGIKLIADIILDEIPGLDAIGGLTMGADPVAYGVSAIAADRGIPLRSFSVRKEAKDHGVEGRIAGALRKAIACDHRGRCYPRCLPTRSSENRKSFGGTSILLQS